MLTSSIVLFLEQLWTSFPLNFSDISFYFRISMQTLIFPFRLQNYTNASFPIPQMLKSKDVFPPNFYYENSKQKIWNSKIEAIYLPPCIYLSINQSICIMVVYLSMARSAITKHNRLGGLNSNNLFSHNSRAWKSQVRAVRFGFSWGSLLGLQMTDSLLAHGLSSVHTHFFLFL